MTEPRPEAVLRELRAHLAVPPPPDQAALTAAVLARLDSPPRRHPVPPRPAAAVAAAVAALLLALGVAMAVSPQVRAAVLDFLRIGGVELNQAPAPSSPVPGLPLPGERQVTLDHARETAGFPIRVPTRLGEPTAVLLAGGDPPQVVTLRYDRVRVDQFPGGLDPLFRKFVDIEAAVLTSVDGTPATWIPAPHPVRYLDPGGSERDLPARLAGTTLIWEQNGLTYRIEGDLTLAQAVTIAESMS